MSYDAGRILIMPKGEWNVLANYEILDTVTYQGKAYISIISNNLGNTPAGQTDSYWFMYAKDGNGIVSITKTDSETVQGRVIDTYTITYTDAPSSTFLVVNGKDGQGVGDMEKIVYDTNNNGKVDRAEIAEGVDGVNLDDLDNADISSPVNRQILRYNGVSEKWENSDAGDLTGYNRTMSEADYRTLEAQSDPVQGTGVYDPDVYFFINNVNDEGWVETAWLLATADTTTELQFNATTIGATDAASIHPTSLIRIVAEDLTTTEQSAIPGVNNTVKPIYARVDYQDEGECQIVFDAPEHNTNFQLWIRND